MSDTTEKKEFKSYISSGSHVAEFTVKSVLLGAIFGIIFGAATVYLALKAGLTVSASIPIAVLAISIGRKFFKTTILENNIIQTTGSAGESIAAGVVFTLPGFLFLSAGSNSESFFSYRPIFFLAALGGILGTLMMIPLRRSLIVEEHQSLPYPEGTACASVLIAGEKGGNFAKTAYYGLAFAFAYAILQKIFHLIAEAPTWATSQANKFFPSATVNGEITPEYMGVGYIIGPKIAGVLVAGGVLAWLGLIPLLATLVPAETIAYQLVKLGYLKDVYSPGGPGGWDPLNMAFANTATAIYQAYVKQIGAGAVAAGGFITLLKTIPTIVSSFKSSLASMNKSNTEKQIIKRTDDDLSFKVVIFGSLGLILLMALLPQIPGDSVLNKLLIGILVIVFGFFFVTVSSRIVGLIGTSSNPVSGMTIATLMGTCLIFISIGWTGNLYEPMALVVGSMICIAAANAGATSQDLKTGYIVGATPRYQQLALFVGSIVSAVVIGLTLSVLDRPTAEMTAQGITHAIGTETYPAPQGTLMATLIKGLLSFNLDWQFVLVGVFLAITIELCGVKSLSFAVGAYLPLSTTLPIFAGGAIKGLVEMRTKKDGKKSEEEELGKGNLFATGLVAGGALMGVIYAFLMAFESTGGPVESLNMEAHLSGLLGTGGYQILGFIFFLFMGWSLYRIAISKDK
ncbi:MAG: OPT/YSL family transporter [Daejeonella sp.]|uniref:OPT family oligopeptide transporter n=1 Tax=Daejeonella sp. TaxID=2805397 RepID=UPI002733DBBE|nr:OPT/YSL family transporter [Daejeonella sp.]MDP3468509.1 OPT/YSL family transporter [Daejeonella sp.]